MVEEYSQPYNFSFTSIPSDVISKTTYTNSSSISSNKVFKLWLDSSTSNSYLDGVTITNSYNYDIYNNPETITTSYSGGDTSIINSTYLNTISSVYHIGKPLTEKKTVTIDGNSFSTEKHFSYSGNLATQIKTKGNGTQFDTETFEYDIYGNIKKKIVTPYNTPSREVSFEYDNSGRFIKKSIDIEGLATTYIYNTNIGTLSKETNPFGQETNYDYDSWNRMIKIIDYLGKNLTTNYAESNYSYTVTEAGDTGLGKVTIYDPLKRVSKVQEKNALGNWVSKSYEYDSLDRLIRESEPYSGSSPTQWNNTNYDFYGRVISHITYAGKYVYIQYNGLSTSVEDGTKTVTSTKNAMGQTTKVVDPGGTIDYTYFGNGSVKTSNNGGYIVAIEQDGWGRKTKMIDPSFGEFTYDYNGYGELINETTPKGSSVYSYDNLGKLISENIQGEETNINTNYVYDVSTKLIKTIWGLNNRTNEEFNYSYQYDSYNRPSITTEYNGKAIFDYRVIRDDFGRVNTATYFTRNYSDGLESYVRIKNIYGSAGDLTEIIDDTNNTSLWKLNSLDVRNKATQSQIGNGIIKNKTFNEYGFLTNISDKKGSGNSQTTALDIDYNFDHQRGNLLSRNNKVFSWSENFNYDNLDRLLSISGAVNHSQSYDTKGRITNNSDVGDYSYTSSSSYKIKDVQLNTKGDLHYQNNPIQRVKYNAFKKPVSIHSKGKGRVDFEYGILKNRSHAYYGGDEEDKLLRRYQKHYSSVTPVEIEVDKQGGTKIITFIGGDAYSAPIVHVKKTGNNSIDGFHYLHRDYLGSILAITDSNANVIEQRQFGAWGIVDKFKTGNSEVDFNNETTLLNRGYTGHEHFFEVALIHMNGRMYDAKVGRFLSPDNYIQQPFSSQSYNRYGYALNNPLKYTDYSGEFIGEIAAGLVFLAKALFVTSALYGVYALATTLDSGSHSTPQQSILPASSNNSQEVASGVPVSNPGGESNPDLPWYKKAYRIYSDYQRGKRDGFKAGGKSTWDLVKGLVTFDKETWKGLGQGMLDMAEMSNTLSARGHFLRTQTASSISEFAAKIPTMSAYEIGYAQGYGTEKIVEAVLLSKGTGIAIKAAQGLKGVNAAKLARSWQGKGTYPGVDNWKNITLKDGKYVIGGLPGQSNYYTAISSLNRSGLSKSKFFEGLQVSKHPQFGYRGRVGIYRVNGNTSAAFGTTYANPQFGAGGLPQIFIPDYSGLELIRTIPLR